MIFGRDTEKDNAEVWLLPLPWDVTTSYGRGAARGPHAICQASSQLDFEDHDFGSVIDRGIYWQEVDPEIPDLNTRCTIIAERIIEHHDAHGSLSGELIREQQEVNEASAHITEKTYQWAKLAIANGKIPGLVGGDHSTPLGLIQALSETHLGEFGVLHIDAHADLRLAYQGFEQSHASIMYNVLQLPHSPKSIVQVGVRDFCHEELERIEQDGRVRCYFDRDLKRKLFAGFNWNILCEEVLKSLPQKVYVSFDIDGLSPEFCPGTGTPVPGGLSFDQAIHLLVLLKESGRQVIGFDLCEVAPLSGSEWDANVGARILYKMCGL